MNTAIAAEGFPTTGALLEKALAKLSNLGVATTKDGAAPITDVIARVADIDPDAALGVARTLDQASFFNAVVRDEIAGMDMTTRYEQIATDFDSIRDDAQRMLRQLEDGQVNWKERAANLWRRLIRGSVPDRFRRIQSKFLEVSSATRDQLKREVVVLEAYSDYRQAIKAAEVAAHQLHGLAEQRLEGARKALEDSNTALSTARASNAPREHIARCELHRDQAQTAIDRAEKQEQICKDLAENLTVGYATGEVVMARLQQTSEAKERVHTQSMTFFTTNEGTFTAISAAMVSMQGTHEAAQTLRAKKAGANQSLETLAQIGNGVNLKALEVGYGPTIAAESVRNLVDAVVSYQETSRALITRVRSEATDNAAEIQSVVEAGKQRMLALRSVMQDELPQNSISSSTQIVSV